MYYVFILYKNNKAWELLLIISLRLWTAML